MFNTIKSNYIARKFKSFHMQLMGSVPADIAIMLLVEQSASGEDELEQNLNIYDLCSKKTGNEY
jgi:hypothetical protein